MAEIKKRSVALVLILSIVTFGIYAIYWLYATKEEMNDLGAEIPTFILAFIPILNFYFTWKYDKRGRIYSQGYHVNIQSTSFKKSLINLHNKLVVTGV